MSEPLTEERGVSGNIQERQVKAGDIIQTGIIYANGDGSIVWLSHQIVSRISADGTIWYRPRDAKVDKTPYHWRWPVESIERIQEDLRHWANPKAARKKLKEMQQVQP